MPQQQQPQFHGVHQQQEMQPWQREQYQQQQQQQQQEAPAWQTDPRFNQQAQDQPSKVNLVPALLASLVLVILSVVGIFTNGVKFEAEGEPNFEGVIGMTSAKFKYVTTNTSAAMDVELGIGEWSGWHPNLGNLAGTMRFQLAMAILAVLVYLFIFCVQCLRLCGIISKPVPVLKHAQPICILALFGLGILSLIVSFVAYANNLSAINEYLINRTGLTKMKSGTRGGGGSLILGLIGLICWIMLIAFSVRTWVGKKCEECCCTCCCCNLIMDDAAVAPQQQSAAVGGPTTGSAPGQHQV